MLIIGAFAYALYYFYPSVGPTPEVEFSKITLPDNFKIEIYTSAVKGARSLAIGPEGIVFVGTRSEGKVYAVVDENIDYIVDDVITVLDGLDTPNGVAYKDGDLYVMEYNRLLKYESIDDRLEDFPEPGMVSTDFPDSRSHGWKYISIGPDDKIYIPVGTPCNICKSEDERFASITRMNLDGSGHEVFAHGVRNTVGFDWHPESGRMWFTDNGRDWLGNDLPPDELNTAPNSGMHFGYPYCHAGEISDPEFGGERSCDEFTPPAQKLGPHVASLGMKFYTGSTFPEEYRNQIFIAEHGSWNRDDPVGYRVALVKLDEEGNSLGYEVFADGWLEGRTAWGRPVDLLILEDGSMLVSDDKGGRIYRIYYSES